MSTENHVDDPEDFDLKPEIFRSGATMMETAIAMQKHNTAPMNVDVKITEADGMALFEGDIVVGNMMESHVDPLGVSRNLGARDEWQWENGKVPYVVQDGIEDIVAIAIAHWHQHTPIRFTPRTNENDYISFERHSGCWSSVGRQGGKQIISIGQGCGIGAAVHEIGHAVGLWHEQSRADRDDYIEVVWENIIPDQRHNFDKHIQDGTDLGTYDHGSIMHYPETAFSANGLPTIQVKNGQSIGQRHGLSTGDLQSIQMLYGDLNRS